MDMFSLSKHKCDFICKRTTMLLRHFDGNLLHPAIVNACIMVMVQKLLIVFVLL